MLPDLSEAQGTALDRYGELLRERAIPLGLVSGSDADRLQERHVLDCLRASALLTDDDALVCDIGSGAGLPGIVLAIARPLTHFVLIEPRHRAVGFIELAVDRLCLRNAEARQARVEDVELSADAATTRAFGPLERSWAAACAVLREGGRLIYFAGQQLQSPVEAACGLSLPEPPTDVEVQTVVADSSPLVIMTRGGMTR